MKLDKYLNESIDIELKEGLDISTSEFWYDLTQGGYLDPMKMCVNPSVARKIKDAIKLVRDFERACEEQIEGFLQ